jgi:hypothetical protein
MLVVVEVAGVFSEKEELGVFIVEELGLGGMPPGMAPGVEAVPGVLDHMELVETGLLGWSS